MTRKETRPDTMPMNTSHILSQMICAASPTRKPGPFLTALNKAAALLLFLLTAGFLHAGGSDQYDRFGGFTGIQREATGFFRVENVSGRWMFITPEGHGYLALGVNHIDVFLANQADAMLQRLGGDRKKVEEALFRSVRDLGFNAGGAYGSEENQFQLEMPWVASLRYPGGEKFKMDVFDPVWQAQLRETVIRQCRSFANDPFVLGVSFIDLPHYGNLRINYFRNLPESAPGRKRYEESKKAGLSDGEFLGIVADTLYARLKSAVREGAPHHLFLGEKFQLRSAPDPVLNAVGKYVDVFCTQALVRSEQRPPEWQTFQKEGYDHEFKLTGKPMLVIDWSSPFSFGEAFECSADSSNPKPKPPKIVQSGWQMPAHSLISSGSSGAFFSGFIPMTKCWKAEGGGPACVTTALHFL